MTGSAASTPMLTSFRRLRVRGVTTETQHAIDDGDQRRKRKPLDRVAAIDVGAAIGCRPLAQQTVADVVRLLDHERQDIKADARAIAPDRQVLPNPPRRSACPPLACAPLSGVGTSGNRRR